MVGARTEVLVHGVDHGFGTLEAFGLTLRQQVEVCNLCTHEQVGRTVGACRHTRATSDTRCRVHRRIRNRLWNGDEVGIGCATSG